MSRAAFIQKAKVKAAKFCSRRERAPYEVLQKLQSWEMSEEEAKKILAELVEERFVDEIRFCKAFCHDKFEFNHWGRIKIKQALFRYKLPDHVIEEGLLAIEIDRYQNVLSDLAKKKWLKLSGDLWSKKQKTVAYLLSKGFEMDLAFEAVNQLSIKQK